MATGQPIGRAPSNLETPIDSTVRAVEDVVIFAASSCSFPAVRLKPDENSALRQSLRTAVSCPTVTQSHKVRTWNLAGCLCDHVPPVVLALILPLFFPQFIIRLDFTVIQTPIIPISRKTFFFSFFSLILYFLFHIDCPEKKWHPPRIQPARQQSWNESDTFPIGKSQLTLPSAGAPPRQEISSPAY